MKTRTKILLALALYLGITIVLGVLFGSAGKNEEFKPQNEFKLEAWIPIKIGSIDLSVNRAVFYLLLASGLTIATMVWIARRMQQKPNRVQTAVEVAYDMTRNNIAGTNLDHQMVLRWFPFVATLFFYIWFSNVIGFLPLPTNTENEIHIFGLAVPTFAIYAATANISIPLVLTLVVWFSYHVEGIRAKGFRRYLASWIPAGVPSAARVPLFGIEVISHFVRIISLTVRLFANILAGHMLILFMGGGLVVLLGTAYWGPATVLLAVAFYLFEVLLIAGLQAYIFATLTAIYLGGAVAESH
jgi:F-type H+-transporting ATPase subunit a